MLVFGQGDFGQLGLGEDVTEKMRPAAISDYLREILNIKNICLILDTAFLYHLEFLTNVSVIYASLF